MGLCCKCKGKPPLCGFYSHYIHIIFIFSISLSIRFYLYLSPLLFIDYILIVLYLESQKVGYKNRAIIFVLFFLFFPHNVTAKTQTQTTTFFFTFSIRERGLDTLILFCTLNGFRGSDDPPQTGSQRLAVTSPTGRGQHSNCRLLLSVRGGGRTAADWTLSGISGATTVSTNYLATSLYTNDYLQHRVRLC